MQLIYLHGAPAVGKLTVGKHLVELAGARLFDNHVAISLARSILEFDDDGFWELVAQTRCLVLKTAAEQGVPLVVMTSCYSDAEDRETLEAYEAVLKPFEVPILPVHLICSAEEAKRRVRFPDRKARGKLATVAELERFSQATTCTPIPRDNCLHISTENQPPLATAQQILTHFQIALPGQD